MTTATRQEATASPATVTALTATVQALMVGSRQVTLSVFNQLDIIAWSDLTPMGRVHSREPGQWAVGVDPDGRLARAVLDPEVSHWHELRAWLVMEKPALPAGLNSGYQRLACIPGRQAHHRYEYRYDDAVQTELADIARRHGKELAASAAYDSLPLIVLAGLR